MNRIELNNLFYDVHKQFEDSLNELEQTDHKTKTILETSKYSIFYNSPFNSLKEAPIYFLGLNPGGGADEGYEEQNLEYFDKNPNWSAYEETWKGEGKTPHQKRVEEILELFLIKLKNKDTNIHNIFCTNYYFFRSQRGHILKLYKNIDCWKYHQKFLNIVKPILIICNGNSEKLSSFMKLRQMFTEKILGKEQREKLYGSFYLKWFYINNAFWGKRKVLVLGLPHLSYYHPDINTISTIITDELLNIRN